MEVEGPNMRVPIAREMHKNWDGSGSGSGSGSGPANPKKRYFYDAVAEI